MARLLAVSPLRLLLSWGYLRTTVARTYLRKRRTPIRRDVRRSCSKKQTSATLAVWLAGWLACWLAGWLVAWLAGGLAVREFTWALLSHLGPWPGPMWLYSRGFIGALLGPFIWALDPLGPISLFIRLGTFDLPSDWTVSIFVQIWPINLPPDWAHLIFHHIGPT